MLTLVQVPRLLVHAFDVLDRGVEASSVGLIIGTGFGWTAIFRRQ